MVNEDNKIYANAADSKQLTKRPKIAFFDYPDVFEDFYPHYGVDQTNFGTWDNTANHAWLSIIQKSIGDVTWIILCIKPEIREVIHEKVGCKIKFLYSSWLHRILWKVFYLPSFAWRWRKFYRSYALIASYVAPLSYELLKALRKEKPDVIFVQDYCSGKYDILLFFSKVLSIPLMTYHGGSTPDKYLGKMIRKFTIRKSNWIFSSGSNESQILQSRFKVNNNLINIIYTPIDTQIYRILNRKNALAKLGLNSNKRYLLFVGRFEDQVKRISSIISVFRNLANKYLDVDLLIVGGGKDEQILKNQSQNLIPDRVFYPGWISKDRDKVMYYNVSECLILASWREGFPTVIGEALSCGIPVVSSNVGGVKDLVVPIESGWLFTPGDDNALERHLDYVLANPEEINSMRRQVRNIAEEKVSLLKMKKALQEGFSTVLKTYYQLN